MAAQHNISIYAQCPKALKEISRIIKQDFENVVRLRSTVTVIDSPNKDEIGKLSAAYKINNKAMPEGTHPIDVGTMVIGHLRAKGIPCHRADHINGMLDENDNFRDEIVLG